MATSRPPARVRSRAAPRADPCHAAAHELPGVDDTLARLVDAVAAEGTAWPHAYILMSADPTDALLSTAERYSVLLLIKPFETDELLRAVAQAEREIQRRGPTRITE
jgi:hypothetical protein